MTALMPRGARWLEVGAILALFLVIHVVANETDLATSSDCYYNYNHYSEGDRILTNEPCLNCTCHNKMLMCYLKVCPFTKPIGQDCTIEKREDQCCPIITCPEVPVELDHSSAQSSTDLATHQNHGCSIEGQFYPEGAQIPGNPKKPCELCYCIRNMTSCVMQECTLHVDGCRPIYNKGVCCPVRYDCAHEDEQLMLEDQTTTEAPSQGFIITTTSAPAQSTDCTHNDIRYIDGELIETEHPCEHCYCMRGDIVCAVQECKPLEMHGKNCTARLPSPGECCPQLYECEGDMQTSTLSDSAIESAATTLGYRGDEGVLTTTQTSIDSASEHFEKEAITTEGAIPDTTSHRIDESENEIHDKDYDHIAAKPARSNFTGDQIPAGLDDRIEGDESTTLLNKLEEPVATTILSETGSVSEEQITTVLPIAGQPQAPEKDATEGEGILSHLYTTIKSIVDFTTTLSPLSEQPSTKHDEETDFLSNVIPGEGDCLNDGISYANNTNVPARNVCEESCLCHNSIVRCEKVKCAPMPPNAENCKIIHEDGLCCPSYHCESMEFSTGTPPTHPAESQVVDRDGGAESTTLSQSADEDTQTNAVDSKLDSTTIQSAQPPISSKLDDSLEMKPEVTTEAKVEKETTAPEIESSTSAEKIHDEIHEKIEDKLGAAVPAPAPAQTEQPTKDEIATEAATSRYEPESTTIIEPEKEDKKPEEQPEVGQSTTVKSAEELPEEIATTQLPLRDVSEEQPATEAPMVKEQEEGQATTQAAAELTTQGPSVSSEDFTTTTQKVQQEDEISTESQVTAKPEDQTQDEIVTTAQPGQKAEQPAEISTDQTPVAQTEGQKAEEVGTTEGTIAEKIQPVDETATEAHTSAPEDQKHDEIATTEGLPSQKEGETEPASSVEDQKQGEISTTEGAVGQKTQPEGEVTTEAAQPVSQTEGPKQDESITTEEPAKQKPQLEEEASTEQQPSTEKQPDTQKTDEDQAVTTEGSVGQKQQDERPASTDTLPEILEPEQGTTAKSEPATESSSTEQSDKQPTEPAVEHGTTEKLPEEPAEPAVEGTTVRVSETEIPVKHVDISTEKQHEEDATDNLIPDSSTSGYVKEHDEIATDKHIESTEKIEGEQVTTEKASPPEGVTERVGEQQPTEISQTTVSSPTLDTKISDEPQEIASEQPQTTISPQPIVPEGEETDKKPEISTEISTEIEPHVPTEHAPLLAEEHHTKKESLTPATESQQSATEHATEIVGKKDEDEDAGMSSSEFTHIFGQQSPTTESQHPASTEHVAEEQTTLSTSKLSLDGVSPSDFKEGEFGEKHDFDDVEGGVTTEKHVDISGTTVASEQPDKKPEQQTEQPEQQTEKQTEKLPEQQTEKLPEQQTEKQPEQQTESTSSEATKESIATEQPAPEPAQTEQAPKEQEEQQTQAPAVSDEKEHGTTEKQAAEATTMYVIPSKYEDLDIITEQSGTSKYEDLDIDITTHHERHDIGFAEWAATESKSEVQPSTEAAGEIETTTLGKVAEEESEKPAIVHEIPSVSEEQATTIGTIAAEKQPVTLSPEQGEQTTYGAITEKSTEPSEVTEGKQEMDIPTTQPPPRPELESESHIADEKQPESSESPVTTEAAKQDEQETTTPGVAPSESLNRIGEDQHQETTPKSEDTQQAVTEDTVIHSEIPKEEQPVIPKEEQPEIPKEELPHVESMTTEQNVVDVTTLLNKIHDDGIPSAPTTVSSGAEEVTTQKQQEPEVSGQPQEPQEPQQTTEQSSQQEHTEQPKQPEQPEQPEATTVGVEHDEKSESQPIEEAVTTEQSAIPMESEATTKAAQQPTQTDETVDATTQEPIKQDDKIHEIPSEATTSQPLIDETTLGVETTSVHSPAEPAKTAEEQTEAPAIEEQTTQHEIEKVTESHIPSIDTKVDVDATTQKQADEQQTTEASVSQAPVESSSQKDEIAPIVPETTAFEHEEISTTSEATKLPEQPSEVTPHDEIPSEVSTEGIQEPEQPSTKPSILDITTIKSVVELLTTLQPKEPEVQSESEVTTSQPADVSTEQSVTTSPVSNRIDSEISSSPQPESYTTESIPVPTENKTSDEHAPVYAMPPESANNIPLIREPSHDEITTKLAESFDMTTLPSILITSSHTDRISDSTTIKNTQNEITESTPPQISDGTLPADTGTGQPSHEPEPQHPSFPPPHGFDSTYGNEPTYDDDYDENEPTVFGPGTCRYGGKLYVSAQQIPRDDPCDFCFCFRSDIICLQQSCPPPINGCHEEPIQGFCCPRYECPVSMALVLNSTTTTTTTLPPYLAQHFQRNTNKVTRSGCQVQGMTYKIGERVTTASGPCIDCICGGDGQMKCDPKVCTPEPMLRQMIASAKRR